MDINSVTLIGRLTRDPESKTIFNDKTISAFSIAVNGYKDDVSFFNCVAFGQTAEFINQYCKKGNRLAIVGRLQQRSWSDKEGVKKSSVEVVVNNVQNLTPKTDKQESFDEAMPF
jgi:single-strand DNA-binding protein